MDKYIIELLKEESTVIVPGLGALMNGATEGTYIFNKYLKINDHKLEEYISKTDGVDAQEAANSVAKLVREINTRLDKGETYDIFGLGKFYKADDGSIDFESKSSTSSTAKETPKPAEIKKEEPIKKAPKPAEAKKEEPKNIESKKEVAKPKIADKSPDLKKEAEKPKNVIKPKEEEKKKDPIKSAEAKKPEIKEEPKSVIKPKTEEVKKEAIKTEVKKEEVKSGITSKNAEPAKKDDTKTKTAADAKIKAAEDKMKAAEAKKKKADDAKVAKAKAEEEKRTKIDAQKKAKEEARKKKLEAKKKKAGASVEKGEKKGGNKALKIVLIILVLIVAGGGAFTIFKWDMVKGMIGMDSGTEEKVEEPKKDDHTGENHDDEHAEDHSNEENVVPADSNHVDEHAGENNEENVEEEPKIEEPVHKGGSKVNVVASAGSYHIIVGGFSEDGNAEKLVAELQSKGYPAQNIGKYSGLNLVSIKSYGDVGSAKSDLGSFSEYNGAWIFKKK